MKHEDAESSKPKTTASCEGGQGEEEEEEEEEKDLG